MSTNKRQHFVSQHYLRQFKSSEGDVIGISRIEPYKYAGLGGIKTQCQEDYFYGANSKLDDMLTEIETGVAPVLARVTNSLTWTTEDIQPLRLLIVQLYLRTRKSVESEKVFPKLLADRILRSAIDSGELPEPPGGWRPGLIDFKGVPEMLIGRVISCWLETATLNLKMLKAPTSAFFITSDNPVLALNQFAADAKSPRGFVGFSQAGFQLCLPVSPKAALFFYDSNVYKVGTRKSHTVQLDEADVGLINSLQIQSAEKCVYFNDSAHEPEVEALVEKYRGYRAPISSTVTSYPLQNQTDTFLHIQKPVLRLPRRWSFCGYRKNVSKQVGERRDPIFTHMIELLERDIAQNPNDEDFNDRVARLFGTKQGVTI